VLPSGFSQQQAIAVLTGLLPEEAGIHFLLIREISESAAGLILAQIADVLLVLTPLRRIRAFARAFWLGDGTGGQNQAASGSRRISRVIMMTNP
jgi:hypothetical protein